MTENNGRDCARAQTGDQAARTAESEIAAPSVMVGVDGSQCALHAALWAADDAARRGTNLAIAHAVDDARHRRAEGQAVLEQTAAAVRARFPELPLDLELSDRSPGDALVTMSRAVGVLVTGTRGRGGFAGMLLGSVTRTLAAHGHCPLVVVRDRPPRDGTGDIVLGVGGKSSSAAARFAFEAARRYQVGLTVVRAWWRPSPVYASMIAACADRTRTDALKTPHDAMIDEALHNVEPLANEFPGVHVKFKAPENNTVPALIDASHDARLLVVGAHRRRGRLSAGAGYVVDGVLAHGTAPIAVVPTP